MSKQQTPDLSYKSTTDIESVEMGVEFELYVINSGSKWERCLSMVN